jgi:hypothetical protein
VKKYLSNEKGWIRVTSHRSKDELHRGRHSWHSNAIHYKVAEPISNSDIVKGRCRRVTGKRFDRTRLDLRTNMIRRRAEKPIGVLLETPGIPRRPQSSSASAL